jgi:hypothetical protein
MGFYPQERKIEEHFSIYFKIWYNYHDYKVYFTCPNKHDFFCLSFSIYTIELFTKYFCDSKDFLTKTYKVNQFKIFLSLLNFCIEWPSFSHTWISINDNLCENIFNKTFIFHIALDIKYTVKNNRRIINPTKGFMKLINPFLGFIILRLFLQCI